MNPTTILPNKSESLAELPEYAQERNFDMKSGREKKKFVSFEKILFNICSAYDTLELI